MTLLRALPRAEVVGEEEILEFIEQRALMGRGIGYVDVHLLASSILTGITLWSGDRRLRHVAAELGLAYR
jgi:predicted nucleic acid-binding protein